MYRYFFILVCVNVYAQNHFFEHTSFSVGYHYSGRNTFFTGLSFSDNLKETDEDKRLLITAGTLVTHYEKKWQFIPELGIWYPPFRDNYLGLLGTSVSTKHIEPQFVVSLLNFFTVHVGYAIPFAEHTFKGVTLGFRVHLAFRKRSAFYIPLKIGF